MEQTEARRSVYVTSRWVDLGPCTEAGSPEADALADTFDREVERGGDLVFDYIVAGGRLWAEVSRGRPDIEADRPFVLVTVSGGIADAVGYGGAQWGLIDWDALPAACDTDEDLRESLRIAREEAAEVPNAERRAQLSAEFDRIESECLAAAR